MKSGVPNMGETETHRAAFERTLIELRPRLHRYCARMVGSSIDGEDLVQEVILRAIDAFPRSGPILRTEAWLFRIAHNTALNWIARRTREHAIFSEEDPQTIADPMNEIAAQETAAASLRLFMQLPAIQRSSIVLKDVLGYSLVEVGTVTGSSTPAVKGHLHRGRTRLRKLAQTDGDAPLPVLREPERSRLELYVERFNARDFDGVRDLLTEDVRLELVNFEKRRGRSGFTSYFGHFGKDETCRLAVGFVDRRPAILVRAPAKPSAVRNFILIEWTGDLVRSVRDYAHAAYVLADADMTVMGGPT
jgi:RNA polymerase sigma-70 factor, ECF subfamily